MQQCFFHFASSDRFLLDDLGREVEDLGKAREHALRLACYTASRLPYVLSWWGWVVEVTDECAQRVLVVPFPDPRTPFTARQRAPRRLHDGRPNLNPQARALRDLRITEERVLSR